MDEAAEILHGGGTTEVVRLGDKVLRTRRQGSDRVEQLLKLLEERGFPYSPRFLGLSSDERQILSYVQGDAGTYPLSPDIASDDALASAAAAMRDLHAVTEGVAAELVGGWMLPDVQPHEVMCHGDFAPYNCVFSGRRLVSLIDFDTAHPGPRIRDVAYAVYRFAPLTAPENPVGFGSVAEQARRARLFCDVYGPIDREHLVEAAGERLVELVAFMRAEAKRGDAAFQAHLRDGHDVSYLRDVNYLRRNCDLITAELLR